MKFPFNSLAAILAISAALAPAPLTAQTPRDLAVELNASAQESPPVITLQWTSSAYTVLAQTVYRRLQGGPDWIQIATPAISATSYADNTALPGVRYEYRVSRTLSGGPGTAEGFIGSGIRAPLVAERGRVILLVDSTMSAPLTTELSRFESDLTGDGWTVVRQDVSRTASPPAIRAIIQAITALDPAKTVALILFGHIPVPYSGDFAIDGHPDHIGAWPTDVYYGDVDGVWTDTEVNDVGASQLRNRNVPGDGKFDQTIIPSDIELQVGRIDLADMPAFALSETELLRQYLERDHRYRHRLAPYDTVVTRGLVDDEFGYFGGEAFAVTGWRSFAACVGNGNVTAGDWFGTLQTQSHLWAYGCGGGTYTSASGIGSTTDFATKASLAVFNVTFGSYFGDWDVSNSFLRAPLAGLSTSLGLVNCWAGRPHWYFHPMALGDAVGAAARLTQNNSTGSGQGYPANYGARFNHIALLGDPTLRLYPVLPPSALTATAAAQAVTLNWTASADTAIEGYVLSRATSLTGPFVRLRSGLVTGTSFVDRSVTPGASYTYLVRAVKLQTSPTGTYLNSSQGVFSDSVTGTAASGPELDLSGNGQPITAEDTGTLAANGTDFGPVETSTTTVHTFTILNAGATPLNISGAAITGTSSADFTITTAPPATIAAGATAGFQVTFGPSAIGLREATCTLTSDDADEASYPFAIGGTGLPPHAEIAVHPPSINRSIHPGDAVGEVVNISDPGPGALVHTVTSSLTRHSALDSDSFAGPTYAWVDISTTGTLITGWSNNDDAISGQIAMGISFPFYGTNFTTIRVCTNGFLSFTSSSASPANGPLPNSGAPSNMIAPLWTDLILDGASGVYWQKIGTDFIVQFENVALYGNAAVRVTCQAILKPTGEIIFQYKTLTNLPSNYTIGIQNDPRDDGLLISYGTLYAHPGLAIRIRPPGLETWLGLSASGGTVPSGGTQQITATLDAAGLAPGDYFANLAIASNATNNAAASIPVRFTVGNTPVENWRLALFGTTADSGTAADDANDDRDLHNNLLEYALVTDPTVGDPAGPPLISMNPGGYLQIQFPRHAARTDLRYLVGATSDLNSAWTVIASGIHGAPVTSTGAHAIVETGGGDVKMITVEDTAPASAFSARYLRLQIVRD